MIRWEKGNDNVRGKETDTEKLYLIKGHECKDKGKERKKGLTKMRRGRQGEKSSLDIYWHVSFILEP